MFIHPGDSFPSRLCFRLELKFKKFICENPIFLQQRVILECKVFVSLVSPSVYSDLSDDLASGPEQVPLTRGRICRYRVERLTSLRLRYRSRQIREQWVLDPIGTPWPPKLPPGLSSTSFSLDSLMVGPFSSRSLSITFLSLFRYNSLGLSIRKVREKKFVFYFTIKPSRKLFIQKL